MPAAQAAALHLLAAGAQNGVIVGTYERADMPADAHDGFDRAVEEAAPEPLMCGLPKCPGFGKDRVPGGGEALGAWHGREPGHAAGRLERFELHPAG